MLIECGQRMMVTPRQPLVKFGYILRCVTIDTLAARGITIHVKALGLPPGRYRIINAATGKPIAGIGQGNALRVPLGIAPGTLMVWHIVPE